MKYQEQNAVGGAVRKIVARMPDKKWNMAAIQYEPLKETQPFTGERVDRDCRFGKIDSAQTANTP